MNATDAPAAGQGRSGGGFRAYWALVALVIGLALGAFADGLPAEMKASMLHDLEAGNRLEATWLSGAVARMAKEAGTSAPVNATLYAAVKPYCMGRAA